MHSEENPQAFCFPIPFFIASSFAPLPLRTKKKVHIPYILHRVDHKKGQGCHDSAEQLIVYIAVKMLYRYSVGESDVSL